MTEVEVLGIAAAIITIGGTLIYAITQLRRYLNYRRTPDYISGLYNGYFVENETAEIHYDLVNIRRTWNGLHGQTLYAHSLHFNYRFLATKLKDKSDLYEGKWLNSHKSFIGSFLFKITKAEDRVFLEGGWLGPKKNGTVEYGEWRLQKTELQTLPRNHTPKRCSENIVSNIITKHEEDSEANVEINGLSLTIPRGVFNPTKGKVSIPLLGKVTEEVEAPDTVLDLGCGCGFYALYFALNGSKQVVASEADMDSLNSAKYNAIKNGLDDRIQFVEASYDQIYHNLEKEMKFDLIIANLPFTAEESCIAQKRSIYYRCFAASRALYFNLSLGAQFHLKKTGVLYFAFSESGYERELDAYMKLGNLDYFIVDRIIHKDDTFLIYRAKLN